MIVAYELAMNVLYEVTEDSAGDVGTLVFSVSVLNEGGFRQFKFLWLTGDYEGQVVEGGRISFNTMMPLKRVV